MGFLKKIGKGLGKIVGGVVRNVVPGGGTIVDIGTALARGDTQQQVPGFPGGFPPLQLPSPEPQPPIRTISNQQTGRTMNGNGFESSIGQLLGGDRIVMETIPKVINTAPPGWVVVDMPDGSGKKAVRKEVAKCLGLFKSRSKPPISASDWKKLKTANRVRNKAKKIAQTADFKCTKK